MKKIGLQMAVLAMVALLAFQIMPAWAPFFAEEGMRLQICTTQGIKTIVFDENGLAKEESTQEHDHCPLCLARETIPAEPAFEFTYLYFDTPKTDRIIVDESTHSDLTHHDPFASRDPPHIS